MIEGIQLRPVAEEDLPLLNTLHNVGPESASSYAWFGFSDPTQRRRRWAENGMLTTDSGTLIVGSPQEAMGCVSWRRTAYGPLNHGWNIGIGLLPEARGRGIGTQAQILLVRYLFAHTQVNRIDAHTDATNVAERRALEKAGFTREGIMRGAQFRNGSFRDMVLYSILRHEVTLG